jgi:hypothetical protein
MQAVYRDHRAGTGETAMPTSDLTIGSSDAVDQTLGAALMVIEVRALNFLRRTALAFGLGLGVRLHAHRCSPCSMKRIMPLATAGGESFEKGKNARETIWHPKWRCTRCPAVP